MLRIAGQTAGPIERNFFWTLMGGRGYYWLKQIRNFISNFFNMKKNSTGNAGSSVSITYSISIIYTLVYIRM